MGAAFEFGGKVKKDANLFGSKLRTKRRRIENDGIRTQGIDARFRDEFIGLVRFDFGAILMDFCSNLVTNLIKNQSKLHQNRIAPNQ